VFEPDDTGTITATPVVCVHGMLVADDSYGDAYMIPLADILNDIKQGLDVSSVSLPQDTQEIVRLLRLKSFLPYSHAPDPVMKTIESPGAISYLNNTLAKLAKVRTRSPSFSQDDTTGSDKYVWYCSDCTRGPRGSWSPRCICGHARCARCRVEVAHS
jgi:hypothetical protein